MMTFTGYVHLNSRVCAFKESSSLLVSFMWDDSQSGLHLCLVPIFKENLSLTWLVIKLDKKFEV